MGHYRRADLCTVPSLLSLARAPLAAVFPCVVDRPIAAIAVLATAGLTDVVDGWYARRFNEVTATGAVVDGITDKVFVMTVVITLVATGRITWPGLVALSTREIGELPLVVWWTVSRAQRRRKSSEPKANVLGKAATVLQFAAVAVATARLTVPSWLLWTTAIAGVVAAARYWRREAAQGRSGVAAPAGPGLGEPV